MVTSADPTCGSATHLAHGFVARGHGQPAHRISQWKNVSVVSCRSEGRGKTGTMSGSLYLVPFYGLASAFLFALSNHFTNMGLERSDARSGTLVSIATSAGPVSTASSRYRMLRDFRMFYSRK